MEEKPITVGPRQFTPPTCLGCYRCLSIKTLSFKTVDMSKYVRKMCYDIFYYSYFHHFVSKPLCISETQMGPIVAIIAVGRYVEILYVKINLFTKPPENAMY